MPNKKNYKSEITDMLSNELSDAEILKLAKNIKNIQKKVLPKSSFTQELRDSLSAEYIIEEAFESSQEKSYLKIFGLIGSCMFIFFWLFTLYDMRINMQDRDFITPIIDQWIPQEILEIHERVVDPTNLEQFNETQIIPSGNNNSIDAPSPQSKMHQQNTKVINSSQESSQTNSMPDNSDSDTTQALQEPASQSMMMSIDMWDQELSDEMYEDRQAIYIYEQERFKQICSDNGWEVLSDEYTCRFTNTDYCYMEDIYQYSANPCEYLYGSE